ncbi:MAG: DUF4190 domain-containing protein [Planctomycetaceae bacterium]|nr:DUF4190 domain-containing protein [Planctomycetaceae bacterium]
MITFNCTCGQSIEVADDMGGKQGRCPKCGQVVTVPAAAPPAVSPPPMSGPWGAPPVAAAPIPALSIVALILSLVALPLLVLWGAGVLFSLAGLVVGIVAWVRSAHAKRGKGMAIAATVVSGSTILLVGVLIAILIPVIGSALGEAQKSSCQMNLKVIGGAMRQYERSKDAVPAKPWDLVDAGYLPPSAFRCGGDKKWQEGLSSYFFQWSSQTSDEANPRAMIACDLKDNHGNGRAYLTRSGNVGWMTEDTFQTALSQPENAAFAAALRTFEAAGAKHVVLHR